MAEASLPVLLMAAGQTPLVGGGADFWFRERQREKGPVVSLTLDVIPPALLHTHTHFFTCSIRD